MFLLELFGALLMIGFILLFLAIVSIPIVLAIAIVVGVVRLVFVLVMLPFRVLGWAIGFSPSRS